MTQERENTMSHGTTKTEMLRQQGLRLNCYLNCEGVGVSVVGGTQGHGTILKLPVGAVSLSEAISHIQKSLK